MGVIFGVFTKNPHPQPRWILKHYQRSTTPDLGAKHVDSTADMASEHDSSAHSSDRESKRSRDGFFRRFKRSKITANTQSQIPTSEQISKVYRVTRLCSLGLICFYSRNCSSPHHQGRKNLDKFQSRARTQALLWIKPKASRS